MIFLFSMGLNSFLSFNLRMGFDLKFVHLVGGF